MQHDDFKSALEAIKLRAPIEDVVRERVPGLKKSGALWKACCPFHEERTPSFTVDPRRGTWHCFGACGTGGDQFSFIQRFDNLDFKDALEILAARTGVTMPKRSTHFERGTEAGDELHRVLELALQFYRDRMRTSEGQSAVRYLRERGLSDVTAEAFGVGYAPSSGQALIEFARAQGIDHAPLEKASLARRTEEGRPYDFFRGRLMIPIKDVKGRVVGFGARRLSDDEQAGPKYVNSAETEVFKKGTLVYALDRAITAVRKSAHIVLVEGYTDVMAAHQCGVATVVAVLGTATTDDHAALIRRTGARRISLVFDGDEAGRKAAYKALHGLLPLEVEIDVVSLTGGIDPCDLCVKDGAQAFLSEIEHARGWFEFLVAGLAKKSGVELSQEVDRVLELMHRLSKPVYRDSRIRDLARELELPASGLFEQYRQIAERGQQRQRPPVRAADATADSERTRLVVDAWTHKAFADLVGAVVVDAGVIPWVRPILDRCPDPVLARIFEAIERLCSDLEATIDEGSVLTALGDDEAARAQVSRCVLPALAMGADFEARVVVEDIVAKLQRRDRDVQKQNDCVRLAALESAHLRSGSVHEAALDPESIEIARRIDAVNQRAVNQHTLNQRNPGADLDLTAQLIPNAAKDPYQHG